MAKVILSDSSVIGRLAIGREEITRKISCDISALKGLLRMEDPNLLVTFEESDREELENLDEKILIMATSILNLEETPTGEQVADALLPKKKIVSKVKDKAKKATKKVKETVVPIESEPSEDVEEVAE